ncbi:MAG: hypothetical protein IPK91_09810 [Saprospiraceae bacterium]|nr:hypothetical protein [Saprospiraceae bacterium]MBK8297552.1 hypothetical protein [Saprospiraceae bacterium]
MKIRKSIVQLMSLIGLAIALSLLLLYLTNPALDLVEKLASELLQTEQNYSEWASNF